MTIDVAAVRADTPGVERLAHFNNAGASLSPRAVTDTVMAHLRREQEIGGYEAQSEAERRLDHAYDAAAAFIGADRSEIAFVENATRAWDMAFYAMRFRPGDRVLTSMAEYASNYIAYLHARNRLGIEIDVVPDDEHLQLDVAALEAMIDDRVKLISVTHVPTNGGLVNPAAAIGAVATRAGVPFLLDACQSVGQLPVDVDEIGCDLLCATGRKYLRGPRGTGFLYVRGSLVEDLDPPMIDLRAATWDGRDTYELAPGAMRFETWESYVAGRLGLATALDYAAELGIEAIWARIHELGALLRDRLATIPGVVVRDVGVVKGGIVSFTHSEVSAPVLAERLRAQGVNVSTSTITSTRLDMERRGLDEVVRASAHYFNTEDEIDRLVAMVRSM